MFTDSVHKNSCKHLGPTSRIHIGNNDDDQAQLEFVFLKIYEIIW